MTEFRLGPGEIDFDPPALQFPEMIWEESEFPAGIKAPNGSGKTSLALALSKAIPAAIWARVELDFCLTLRSGRTLSLEEISGELRVLPQMWQHYNLGYSVRDDFASRAVNGEAWQEHVWSQLGLADIATQKLSGMSDGERRRAMVALVLAERPPMVISDEWYDHLDLEWQRVTESLFEEFQGDGGAHVWLVSHEPVGLDLGKIAWREADFGGRGARRRPIGADLTTALGSLLGGLQERGANMETPSLAAEIPYTKAGRVAPLKGEAGELVEVVGRNGAGKSTLLRNLWKESRRGFRFWKRQEVPPVKLVLADSVYQLQGPTVKEELGRLLGNTVEAANMGEVFGEVGDRDVISLSFGERKVVSVLSAVLCEHQVIAIDEPYSGLDEANREAVEEILAAARNLGKIVIVAHPEATAADSRVVRLGKKLTRL